MSFRQWFDRVYFGKKAEEIPAVKVAVPESWTPEVLSPEMEAFNKEHPNLNMRIFRA